MTLDAIYHSLNPVAFSIGAFSVRWYGIAYLAGFVLGGWLMFRVARRWKLNFTSDDAMTAVTAVALGTIIGGRTGYVLFYGAGYYWAHPLEIFALNQGGMSFHGGLTGSLILGYLCCKRMGWEWRTLFDLGCMAMPVGLFFGRIANFINGELWGKSTDLPWGVVFETGGGIARHPSQLYEALLEGLVIGIVMLFLVRKKPPVPQGTLFGTFLLLYGFFRFLIEFVRLPDTQIGYLLGTDWFTMGQLLSLPLMAIGVAEVILAYRRARPQRIHPSDPVEGSSDCVSDLV